MKNGQCTKCNNTDELVMVLNINSLLGRERNGSINVLQNRFALYMR